MNDTSVVLSISMLISGKKDMQKSLESLHYFKDALPCEIILVDTGCSAEQRALAEQYADQILDFAWCDDFAAARNVGLKAARGEWFLYLDDDEWFDNPAEIIEFFRSGEYRNYNCASYVVRNYSNAQGTMYDDSYPSRMVKLTPETRFTGKIHEYLEPFELPKKTFSDFVHHYGYVYRDEGERRAHACRNINPLLEMRKQYPGDPRWICQLAQEYFSIHEYEEVIRACETGLEEWNTLKNYIEYAPAHIGAIYAYLLISMECMKEFEEEEKWLHKALSDPLARLKIMEPSVAFYCLVGAKLYNNLKKHELCRDYCKRYLDYARRLENDRDLIEDGTAAIVEGVFQEQLLYGTVLKCMESIIRAEDYALAEEAFYRLDWSDRRLLRQNEWEKAMVDACCSVAYHPLWVRLLQTLVAREDGMKEMYAVLLETELGYRQQEETEKLARLRRLVSELEYDHRYILYTKILWAEQESEAPTARESCTQLFGQLFARHGGELFEIRAEVWDVAKRLEIPMEPMLLQVDYRCWKRTVETWSASAALSDLQQWDARIAGWKRREDIRYDLFAVKCLEGYLRLYRESCSGPEELERMLWQYADLVLAFYRPYYKEFVFDETPMILPEEAQLALGLNRLRQFREQGDDRKALEQMRNCLGIYPALADALDTYARWYRDGVQRRNRRAEEKQEQEELAGLVDSLKRTARLQIERGEYQAAREILLQMRQCVPGDEEVDELLEQLSARKKLL